MRIPATMALSPSGMDSSRPAMMVRALRGRHLALARGSGRALAGCPPIALLHRREALFQQLGEVDDLGPLGRALAFRRRLHLARGLVLDELHQVLAIRVLELRGLP